MKKHPWERAWANKSFEMTTQKPSVIVRRYKDKFSSGDYVLDVGCGNGRNAIYLVTLGCYAECFDVANTKWYQTLPHNIKKRIYFKKSDIYQYPYACGKYKAVIVARVIQYLNKEELLELIQKIRQGLTPEGFLLMSFNSQGGIFKREEIDVPKYHYTVQEIKKMLKKYFKRVVITEGARQSRGVNYQSPIKSYDLYADGLL